MLSVRIMKSMKIVSSYGPKRTKRTHAAALVTAGILVVLLVSQLFGYEDFASVLGILMPYNDNSLLKVTAAAVVIAELLALPYLLGMYLSPLMRLVSAGFGAGVTVFWLFTCLTNSHATNSGLFSTSFELQGGIIATLLSLILFSCVVLVIRADVGVASTPLEKKH